MTDRDDFAGWDVVEEKGPLVVFSNPATGDQMVLNEVTGNARTYDDGREASLEVKLIIRAIRVIAGLLPPSPAKNRVGVLLDAVETPGDVSQPGSRRV